LVYILDNFLQKVIVSLKLSLLFLWQLGFIDGASDCLGFLEPSKATAVLPFSLAARASINFAFVADAMLEVLFPHANVHGVILNHGSFAPLLAVLELTVVLATVCPHLFSLSVHLTILKVTVVSHFVFSEVILAVPMESVLNESSFEIATVLPSEVTLALFKVILKFSFESAIRSLPSFGAVTAKFVVFPNAFVFVALFWVLISSVAVCRVILPLAIVVLTVEVD
jgi:hypothetical protein